MFFIPKFTEATSIYKCQKCVCVCVPCIFLFIYTGKSVPVSFKNPFRDRQTHVPLVFFLQFQHFYFIWTHYIFYVIKKNYLRCAITCRGIGMKSMLESVFSDLNTTAIMCCILYVREWKEDPTAQRRIFVSDVSISH